MMMNNELQTKTVRPDNKGRITLGDLAKNISGFRLTIDAKHRIILEPMVEVPAHEKWLFENKEALKQVQQGLKDAAAGKTKKRGDFSQYVKD